MMLSSKDTLAYIGYHGNLYCEICAHTQKDIKSMTIYFSTTSTESSNENKKNVEKGACKLLTFRVLNHWFIFN